jgi:hypothetical protein
LETPSLSCHLLHQICHLRHRLTHRCCLQGHPGQPQECCLQLALTLAMLRRRLLLQQLLKVGCSSLAVLGG